MLQAATLLLALLVPAFAEVPAGRQDPPPLTLTGELKDIPAQGKDGPLLQIEGTTNLRNGSVLLAYLYHGKIVVGREIFKDTPIVKNGRYSQDFAIFKGRNFPGTYTARIIFDPNLQNLGGDEYPRVVQEFKLQIGDAKDYDQEGKVVRERLVAEIRALVATGDEMKAKFEEMKDKPQADREALLKGWLDKANDIRARANPRRNPEFYLLRLDLIADADFEEQINILIACGRCFVLKQREDMLEGLTRLKQACDVYISDIITPRLTELSEMTGLVEECRALLRKVVEHPDDPVLPARRRYLEATALLDKSVPGIYHEVLLGATSRGAAFFNAASDKSPDLKALHADLDGLLERFGATLRDLK